MCIFILECFGNYIKSITDYIMTIICTISSITGLTLIYGKIKPIKLIDNNLTWIEVCTPVVVGTGGCIIYNIICYGIKKCYNIRIPENAIELTEYP